MLRALLLYMYCILDEELFIVYTYLSIKLILVSNIKSKVIQGLKLSAHDTLLLFRNLFNSSVHMNMAMLLKKTPDAHFKRKRYIKGLAG